MSLQRPIKITRNDEDYGKYAVSTGKNSYLPHYGLFETRAECLITCELNNANTLYYKAQEAFAKACQLAKKVEGYDSIGDYEIKIKGNDFYSDFGDNCC